MSIRYLFDLLIVALCLSRWSWYPNFNRNFKKFGLSNFVYTYLHHIAISTPVICRPIENNMFFLKEGCVISQTR